ncbi:hypothetical protein BMF89_13965 [Arthrobacter sp. SRS-W-1-2016]|uniref:hypothetical protein n=1 Tax=Arthrobacter sp. SRS-W-1-2016 TaxID=1930254 RepID=UPI000990F24E|nr:hypothetical protein [Arthrobacter sp. SRS-W-1-2016]OOP61104.1 hypothetical protein BMF89_13965 [Arthrobacter sp. SRS-W-1-2016]
MTVPQFEEEYVEIPLPAAASAKLADIAASATADVGALLTTISLWRPGTRDLVRVFSTMPGLYRLGGISSELGEDWLQHCVVQQESFLASDQGAIDSDAFEHQDVLGALHLGAAINAVIVHNGRFLGCLNLLDVAGAYSEPSVRRAEAYAEQLAEVLRAL